MDQNSAPVEDGEVQEVSDSSDSDQDSSEDEQEVIKKESIRKLEYELEKDPYYYEGYKSLIKLFQKDGDLDKLRKVREAMSLYYPLTEELWLDWIKDEKKIATNEVDHENISKLFNRAVDDYLHAGVWLEYVQYIIGRYDVLGIKTVRDIFTKAIQAVGVHVVRGSSIWCAYREFENALLCGMQPQAGAVMSEERKKEIEAQMNLITDLFRRQLSVPLGDVQEAYSEYQDWCDQKIDVNFNRLFLTSKTKLEKLRPFEEGLIKSAAPHYAEYIDYIDYCIEHETPVFIQCVFERAIQENCLEHELWMKYANFLENHLPIPDICRRIHSRAIRNCPWSSQLWINYARSAERHTVENENVGDIYEKALVGNFEKADDFLKMWMDYCDYKRRKIKWETGDNDAELEELRELFKRAIDYQEEYFAIEGDPNFTLMKYWAKVEAKFAKSIGKARVIWKDIIYKSGGNKAEIWLQKIELERLYGDPKHLRSVFNEAVAKVYDQVELIIDAYINYEKQEGSLEDLDKAHKKCGAKMKLAEERLAQKARKLEKNWNKQHKYDRKMADKKKTSPGEDQRNINIYPQKNKSNLKPVKKSDLNSEGFKFPHQMPNKDINDPESNEGVSEDVEMHSESQKKVKPPPGFKAKTEDKKSVKPPPGYTVKDDSSKAEATSNGSQPQIKKVVKPPPGYKPQLDGDDSQPPTKKAKCEKDETGVEEKNTEDSYLSKTKLKTVFISNLEYTIDVNRIKEIFSKVGGMKDVRLIGGHEIGHSKGYGYVEFEEETYVPEALKLDRYIIDKRPMFVSKVRERNEEKPSFKYATNMEKNKLFVKGLPYKMTKEELSELFEKHGKVKDLRIVTYRNGYSKGMAYIEFEKASDASKAVMKYDGMEIDGQIIYVAISDPPIRKGQSEPETTKFTPALGGAKRKDINEKRTQLSFVPRNIKSNANEETKASSNAGNQSNEQSSLSNKDFRALLLGNK